MKNKPLVSVIMPLYNASEFLFEAIRSVINQTYENWELIIVDDGSTDDSLAVVKRYESDKIRVYTQPNSGACVARNKALSLAKGELIKFLDADDVLFSECLDQQVNQIFQLEMHQIPFGDYNFIDKESKLLFEYSFDLSEELYANQPYFFSKHWEIITSSPLHRKELLISIDGFDESLARGQEFDLHFRLALSDVEFIYFPTRTYCYRSHQSPSRISTGTKEKITYTDQLYLETRYLKFERLLKAKYNAVPKEYYADFFYFWFSWARQSFGTCHKKEGLIALEKANEFMQKNHFFKWYTRMGRFIGFINLERLFQLRLKLIKKKQSQHVVEGIAKYI